MNRKLSFKITNFRNIIDTSIDIWPDKINFIVGDNNIGKSNILDAISMMNLVSNTQNKKFVWNSDTPSCKSLEQKITEISVSYDLPKNYISDKFSKINIKPEDFGIHKNKFIKTFCYYRTSNNNTDGLSDTYSKLFVDEELEKTYTNKISEIRDKLIDETYPNFIKICGTDTLKKYDVLNFSYQDLLNGQNDAFSQLFEFLCAFANDWEQTENWLNQLKEIKNPTPSALVGEKLKRYQDNINKIKKTFIDEINKNISELYKDFSNLHCKLVVEFDNNNNIRLSIKPDNNLEYYALTYGLQGNGVKKLINLVYRLQLCKNQPSQKYIFLIDEIEESLSINSQISLITYLKEYLKNNDNVYLVIVTHAPSFFDLKENEKYSDYMYLNICSQNNDGSLSIEKIIPDTIISENAGYELKNGKNAFDGIRFLSIALDMPDTISKKVINK